MNFQKGRARQARQCADRERGRKAPRVNRRAENRGAGRVAAEALSRSRRLKKRLVLQCDITVIVKKSTCSSFGGDFPGTYVDAGGASDLLEERGFGRGHPYLAAPLQTPEERFAPLRVEMRGDLIQEKDRRRSAPVGDEIGMGKDEAE